MKKMILPFLVSLLFIACNEPIYDEPTISVGELELNLLHEINEHRFEIGIGNIFMSQSMLTIAREHSIAMANGQVPFNTDGSEQRYEAVGELFQIEDYAEIVGTGSSETVVKNWLATEVHILKLEGDYDLSGLGVGIDRDGTVFATLILIKTKY